MSLRRNVWIVALSLLIVSNAIVIAGDDKEKEKVTIESDAQFVMMAAQGGMAEVKLGQLAADKGTSQEVKQFGQMMVTDHTKANDELKALAQQKGWTVPTDMGKHQKEFDKLSGMSGTEFDQAFTKCMVKDHMTMVDIFQQQSQRGQDSDLKAWAAKTLPTLQSHLTHAKDMHKSMKGK